MRNFSRFLFFPLLYAFSLNFQPVSGGGKEGDRLPHYDIPATVGRLGKFTGWFKTTGHLTIVTEHEACALVFSTNGWICAEMTNEDEMGKRPILLIKGEGTKGFLLTKKPLSRFEAIVMGVSNDEPYKSPFFKRRIYLGEGTKAREKAGVFTFTSEASGKREKKAILRIKTGQIAGELDRPVGPDNQAIVIVPFKAAPKYDMKKGYQVKDKVFRSFDIVVSRFGVSRPIVYTVGYDANTSQFTHKKLSDDELLSLLSKKSLDSPGILKSLKSLGGFAIFLRENLKLQRVTSARLVPLSKLPKDSFSMGDGILPAAIMVPEQGINFEAKTLPRFYKSTSTPTLHRPVRLSIQFPKKELTVLEEKPPVRGQGVDEEYKEFNFGQFMLNRKWPEDLRLNGPLLGMEETEEELLEIQDHVRRWVKLLKDSGVKVVVVEFESVVTNRIPRIQMRVRKMPEPGKLSKIVLDEVLKQKMTLWVISVLEMKDTDLIEGLTEEAPRGHFTSKIYGQSSPGPGNQITVQHYYPTKTVGQTYRWRGLPTGSALVGYVLADMGLVQGKQPIKNLSFPGPFEMPYSKLEHLHAITRIEDVNPQEIVLIDNQHYCEEAVRQNFLGVMTTGTGPYQWKPVKDFFFDS